MSSGTARQKIYWFMNSWKVNESSCFLLYHRFSNTLTILQCLEVHTIKLKKNTNCPIRLFPKSSSFLPEYYMVETVASTDSTLVWIVTTFNPQKTGLLESPGLCRTGSIIHRTYITTKYSEFKTSDIRHLLSFLRWTNLLTSFVVCTFTILTSISYLLNFNISTFLLSAYCCLFSGILFLFELHTKRINNRFKAEYGFLFTYIGRSVFILL